MFYPLPTSSQLAQHDAWLEKGRKEPSHPVADQSAQIRLHDAWLVETRKEPLHWVDEPARICIQRRLLFRVGKWLVSTEGGAEPAWSPDARELYYRDSRGMLVAARLGEGSSFSVAGREQMFSVEGFVWDPVHTQYAVHPDGERFLMLRLLEDGSSRVAWIEDFASGLVAGGEEGR